MTRTLALVVLTAVALPAGAADDKYASKDGRFTIAFPAGETVKAETKKGADTDIHIATVKAAGKTYIVTYLDLPAAAVKDVPAKTFFDAAQKSGALSTGAKLDSSKDFEFGKDKHPARDVVADKNGDKVRSRLVLAGTRLYILTVGGPGAFATSKDATAFLDSFELTK